MNVLPGGDYTIALALFCIMAAGWALAWKKVIGPEGAKSLVRLTGLVAVPTMTGYQALSLVTPEILKGALPGALIAFASTTALFVLGIFLARALHVPEGRRGLFTVMFSLANTILVGMPIVESFCSDAALPYVAYFFIANTFVLWTAGAYLIRRDAVIRAGKDPRFTWPDGFKRLVSPALIAFLLGCAVNLLGITLPSFLTVAIGYVAHAAPPMAMFYAGLILYLTGKDALRIQKGQLMVFAGRFLIGPAVMFACCLLFGLPVPMRQAFVLEAAMPTMAQSMVISGASGADSPYAASTFWWTLMLSMAAVPLLALLLSAI